MFCSNYVELSKDVYKRQVSIILRIAKIRHIYSLYTSSSFMVCVVCVDFIFISFLKRQNTLYVSSPHHPLASLITSLLASDHYANNVITVTR